MIDHTGFELDAVDILSAIDAAEVVPNPLAELVDRAKADPGAPFEPCMLTELAALKKQDRPRFEKMRAELKRAGVRVATLDDSLAENSDGGGAHKTQADILIELANQAVLFHTPDGGAFADVSINSHRETWPVRAKGFKGWLCKTFYEDTGGAPNSEALQAALNVIEAVARYNGEEISVWLRVGEEGGKVYIDLADADWRAVEIDTTGWRVVSEPPVRFRRTAGMLALPEPVRGGTLDALRSFINVKSDDDFMLAVAWLAAAVRARGPYPVLCIAGEQGSAKSTFSAIMRSLVDPNSAPLRTLPREDRDLFIAATNGHVLAFDNLSGIPLATSDTLCRLATGGGFAVRALYTDSDETMFNGARPIIANGIDDFVTRPDLADRSIFLTLAAIPEDARRLERDVWAAFDKAKPAIMGALFDAVARGLGALPFTNLERLPRMADFAIWATACGKGLWPDGAFMTAYAANRKSLVANVIESSPVAAAISELMASRTTWSGTYGSLSDALAKIAGETAVKSKSWPADTVVLGRVLHRVVTALRETGIEMVFGRDAKKHRTVTLSRARTWGKNAGSTGSAGSPFENNGLAAPVAGTVAGTTGPVAGTDPARTSSTSVAGTVAGTVKALINQENTREPAGPADSPTQSGCGKGCAPLAPADPEPAPARLAMFGTVTAPAPGMRRIRI